MEAASSILEKWESYKNTTDLGKQCRHLGRRRKAELAGAAVGGKPCRKAKNSSGGEFIAPSPILSGGNMASSPAAPEASGLKKILMGQIQGLPG